MADRDLNRRRFVRWSASSTFGIGVFSRGVVGEKRSVLSPTASQVATDIGYVILTFDHADPSVYETGFPITQEFDYPALITVVADRISSTQASLLGLKQLHELQSAGWEIGSHSMTEHPDFMSLSEEELKRQCSESKRWLAEHGFESDASAIAYPMERVNEAVADIAREYFATGFGGGGEPGRPITDPLIIPRVNGDEVEATKRAIDEAAAENRVLAIMYHTVGLGNDRISETAFRETMARIESKGDALQVITPSTLDRLLSGAISSVSTATATNNTMVSENKATETKTTWETSESTEKTSKTPKEGQSAGQRTDGTVRELPTGEATQTTAGPSGTTGTNDSTESIGSTDPGTTTDTNTGTDTLRGENRTDGETTRQEGDPVGRTATDGPGFGITAALGGIVGWLVYRLRIDEEKRE